MSLSARVLLGLGLGILCGVFFGDLVTFLGVIGQAFILLLQMAVLPYVTVSLIAGLGSLSYAEARSLVSKAGIFLLILWALAVVMVLLTPLAYPDWKAASFFSTSLVEQGQDFNFLELYIPANPFKSLAESVVPAVVLFSIAFGVALIGIERKQTLLETLNTITDALTRIANFVVGLAPIGVFAIAAHAAATMNVDQLRGLQVYGVIYAAMALLLTLWTLPALVAALTPLRYREIVGPTRDALVTAFATGSVFVVLPILAAKCKELLSDRELNVDESEAVVDVIVPSSFNFPSVGKLLTLSFVLFAGWLSGFAVSASQYPTFVLAGVLSFFGSSLVAVPFLLDLFRIPADTFQLFVIIDSVVCGRFGAALASMHILALSLFSACAVGGLVVVRWGKLLRFGALTVVLTVLVLGAVRFTFEALGHEYEKYELFIARELLYEPVPSKVLRELPDEIDRVDREKPVLDRIRERGFLRVGYLKDRLPFAFQNANGHLVGFDVEMAHALARQLGVKLELVRIDWKDMAPLLERHYLDIVMSGISVTPERVEKMTFSAAYLDETLAFVVRDYRRDEFSSRKAVQSQKGLKIGILDTPYYVAKLKAYLPEAKVVILDSPREFFTTRSHELDALLYSAEGGSSWSLIYPQFTVAVPHPDVLKSPIAYPLARGDVEMLSFVSTWISLKEKDRTIDRLFDYWIRGEQTTRKRPRWSVVRNVLKWVD